ncbi:hypothetical protein MHZ92_10060 [Sporosarcina sp. ACRSL]|uniref:hypothetical protein n=1 Tax=Sporosarcina sp. ACRSL TaxID=2918215 RepID=UPI001EF58AE3|nr:hypothetical protein [Sporosarcina sp. ACRSL]MCG7344479.1 hypothetical protein [Sporosarcina sp. ACRSL]
MKKVLISLVAVGVLVAGIYFIVNLTPPKPTITIEKKTVESAQGSYCWNGLMKQQCVDMITPPELIKHHELTPVAVSPGAELTIEFNRKPQENSLVTSIWFSNDEVENVPLHDNVVVVPREKGVYIYNVSAHWEKGSSSYAFVIEVK